jgi:hypothetical protein
MPDTEVVRGAVTDSPSFWHMIGSLLFVSSSRVAGNSGLRTLPFIRNLIKAGFLENFHVFFLILPGTAGHAMRYAGRNTRGCTIPKEGSGKYEVLKKRCGLPRERAIPFPVGGTVRLVAGPTLGYNSVR